MAEAGHMGIHHAGQHLRHLGRHGAAFIGQHQLDHAPVHRGALAPQHALGFEPVQRPRDGGRVQPQVTCHAGIRGVAAQQQLVQRQPLHIGQLMLGQLRIGLLEDGAEHLAHEEPHALEGRVAARAVEVRGLQAVGQGWLGHGVLQVK